MNDDSLEWRLRKLIKEDINMVLGAVNDRAEELRTEMNIIVTNALAATFAEFMQVLNKQTATLLEEHAKTRRELVAAGLLQDARIENLEIRTSGLEEKSEALDGRMTEAERRLDEKSA